LTSPTTGANRIKTPLTPSGIIPESEQEGQRTNDKEIPADQPEETDTETEKHQNASSSQPKATSATCISKAAERIKIELPSHRINGEIQYMQDHALIGKFLGFWPTEKALHGWIASKWKPKGQVTLQLGPKGFFTAIFNCVEDKSRIFEGGPYFFNSSGLYLTEWKPRFNPDKEDFSWAPVWIRMYSLPVEYWKEETLADIGNKLGTFIKVAAETKTRKYTSYARICMQMHLTKTLADSVSLFHDDFEWIQTLDYEHIPFRCRKCHVHGHLFRDCPLNQQSKASPNETLIDSEGFTKIPNRRRHTKKSQAVPENTVRLDSRNKFSPLATQDPPSTEHLESVSLPSSSLNPSAPMHTFNLGSFHSPLPPMEDISKVASDPSSPSAGKGKSVLNSKQQASAMDLDAALALGLQEATEEDDQSAPSNMEQDPENIILEGIGILKLETACKKKEYNTIPPWQIDRLEGVLAKVQHNRNLGILGGSPWDGKKNLKETKKRGRKTDLQRTIAVGELLMESGRFPKLTKFYKPTSQLP